MGFSRQKFWPKIIEQQKICPSSMDQVKEEPGGDPGSAGDVREAFVGVGLGSGGGGSPWIPNSQRELH